MPAHASVKGLKGGVFIVWACGLTLAGCTRSTAVDNLLILGTVRDPATLDPAFAQLSREQEIVRLLYRDLTVLDDSWALQPDLAEALPAVTTGTTSLSVKWRLRAGLKWSDGQPLTANDVRFGWKIEADPKLEGVSHETASNVLGMLSEGPRDLRVTWKTRYADYQAPRVHAVLPAHAYPRPRTDRPFVGIQSDPVSSGPFRLTSRVPGQSLTFARNPHWHGPKPALDRIIFRVFASEDGFEAALATGAIHALGEASGLTPDRVAALRSRLKETHEVVTVPGGVLLHLDVRHDHPGLSQPKLRRALSAAIDRRALAAVTYDGLAEPAFGVFPPRHPGHDSTLFGAAFDPKAARTVVAAMPPPARTLTLAMGAGSGAAARAGAFIQAALQDVGFTVRLRTAPMSSLFSEMRAGNHAPLVLYAWRIRPDWDGASVLVTDGRQNYGHYASPTMDALIKGLGQTFEPDARRALLRAVEAQFRADLPAIPLLFRKTVSVRPKKLTGWRPTGTVTPVTWNAEDWAWAR